MLKISRINWTAKKLVQLVAKGEVVFDNPMQRGLVWNAEKKSKLIDSMIEGYPVPSIYTEKSSSGIYDVLDGKQRCTTIVDYLNNKFALKTEEPVELSDGTIFNISRKYFNELPEEIQDRISDFNLSIYHVDDASVEQKKEMFIRLNSGKAISNVELTKAQTKSAEQISIIGNHPIFKYLMNEEAINKSNNIGFAMQIYSVLYNESKCLLNSKIKETMKTKRITDSEVNTILDILNYFEKCFEELSNNKSLNVYLLSKIKRKSHFISMIPVVQFALENNIETASLVEWFNEFFYTGDDRTTFSEEYNSTLAGGMNQDTSVRTRIDAALNHFKNYVENKGLLK